MTKKKPKRDWLGRQWDRYCPARCRSFLAKWWPIVAIVAGITLGTAAFVVGGKAIHDLSEQHKRDQQQNRQIARQAAEAKAQAILNRLVLCAAARVRPAPQTVTETKTAYRKRVHTYGALRRAAHAIDCRAALRLGLPKGGGAQSSPTSGSQLPGGRRPPPESKLDRDRCRHRLLPRHHRHRHRRVLVTRKSASRTHCCLSAFRSIGKETT